MVNQKKGLKIVGLYVRVSTLNQVDRDSLKTQEERLKAYCAANGIKEFKIYKDARIKRSHYGLSMWDLWFRSRFKILNQK